MDKTHLPNSFLQYKLYGKEDIRLTEENLKAPNSKEIIIKILYATTCGTDIKNFHRGGHPKMYPSMPAPFGHEFCGEVVASGNQVQNFKIGDQVLVANSAPCLSCFFCQKEEYNLCENLTFLNGGYGEYLRIPKNIVENNTHIIPKNVPLIKASLTEPLACVLQSFQKLNVHENDFIAIYGTGPMAFFFINLAKIHKCKTAIIGRNSTRLNWAKEYGVDHIINNQKQDPIKEIKKLTGGYGSDIAIEAVGLPEIWQETFDLVRKGGKVCMYGGCPKGTKFSLDTYRLHYDEITLLGTFHHTPQIIKKALNLLSEKEFNTSYMTDHILSLKSLPTAFQTSKDKPLKFVIDPNLK